MNNSILDALQQKLFTDRQYIVGLAMDAQRGAGSEDFIYMDTIDWSDEKIQKAKELRHTLGYFIEGKAQHSIVDEPEYPTKY